MKTYFADFHIHVGMSRKGKWIKIPTSKKLTIENIFIEAAEIKGMNIIGIIDALSPLVLEDIEELIEIGTLNIVEGGGYCYQGKLIVLLGAEIETVEKNGAHAHCLIYLPDIEKMKAFSQRMSHHIRSIHMSSQNSHMTLDELIKISQEFEAVVVPAHIFTPHKSLYGAATERIGDILSPESVSYICAMELGLSADTVMADCISELGNYTFLTNSDAHSLEKIAREYNCLALERPNFQECIYAFKRMYGRSITANYGIDPRLGKYHRTVCSMCGCTFPDSVNMVCECGSRKFVRGVMDRIEQIADSSIPRHPSFRPPYYYQIPLQFIPGIGKKTLNALLTELGTEMFILHEASNQDIIQTSSASVASSIINARKGNLNIVAGGGGIYGKVK